MIPAFMFATGIENSYPTIQQGRVRVDEMEKCGHYDLWRRDFDLVQEMGIRFLGRRSTGRGWRRGNMTGNLPTRPLATFFAAI